MSMNNEQRERERGEKNLIIKTHKKNIRQCFPSVPKLWSDILNVWSFHTSTDSNLYMTIERGEEGKESLKKGH